MSSTPNRLSLMGTTALTGFDPVILSFIDDLRRRGEIAEGQFRKYRYVARHFLIWLEHSGIALEAVDGKVIDLFLQHDCCCGRSTPAWIRRWRKCRTSSRLMRFIHFLERTGRIATPGELDDNLQLLDAFLMRLRSTGHATATIKLYRHACTGLIVWLHLSRIRLCDLTLDILARFRNRQFVCSIPGVFRGQESRRPETAYETELRGFLNHLVAIGRIEPLEPRSGEKPLPARLERYAAWLERHRGIRPGTIRQHVRLIAEMLPSLGDDPSAYDAALIRWVMFQHMERWSRSYAQRLTTVMRMYLRFLASEGSVAAALLQAVPTVPHWRLSTLPRYIPEDDVERAIASCGDDPLGVRDRAILLLLARLALRAGDIVDLRLDDIEWDRAEIRVSGKSRRQTVLPLPQDAGDALYAYIATVRPRVDDEKVFLCVNAPCRSLTDSSTVSAVAERALDRAGIRTFAGRGAHAFRHSQATALLRSGATLSVIQSLLRHTSPNTTTIYAKTDAVMLQEVAQPWIGGIEQ